MAGLKPLYVSYTNEPIDLLEAEQLGPNKIFIIDPAAYAEDPRRTHLRLAIERGHTNEVVLVGPMAAVNWRLKVNRDVHFIATPCVDDKLAQMEAQASVRIIKAGGLGLPASTAAEREEATFIHEYAANGNHRLIVKGPGGPMRSEWFPSAEPAVFKIDEVTKLVCCTAVNAGTSEFPVPDRVYRVSLEMAVPAIQAPSHEKQDPPELLRGTTREGKTVWYTGRAGDDWVSPHRKDAFTGFNWQGASQKAIKLNKLTVINGITFSPVPITKLTNGSD